MVTRESSGVAGDSGWILQFAVDRVAIELGGYCQGLIGPFTNVSELAGVHPGQAETGRIFVVAPEIYEMMPTVGGWHSFL